VSAYAWSAHYYEGGVMKRILLSALNLSNDVVERGQCDCNCDCACASVPPSLFLEVPSSALLRRADNLHSLPLSSEYNIFLSLKNIGPAVLDSYASNILNIFHSPISINEAQLGSDKAVDIAHQLTALGLLVAVEDDCACAARNEIFNSTDCLTTWLHLTDRCNLRCDYCYLPHVCEDMSSETGRAVVNAIFRSAKINHFKQVKIKYAGGEPLLRYPLILELHTYAKSLANMHGLILGEVVLCNGTLLTEEIAKSLKALDIRLMISLDGFGTYHDIHRSYVSGRGSFNDVSEAINLALANGLVPTISVTVSNRTAEGLPEIMAWILERDLPFSLNFYRENELSASHADMRLGEEKIINGMLSAFKVIEENLPKRDFLGGILDRANLSSAHTHTCGVGQNYLVFDQSGQIAKCQMQIRKPVTNVHFEDPLAIIRGDQIGIQNFSVEEKEGCKACEWKYWCAGGCPLETRRGKGRYNAKSPNCNIYKALFPEVLRLEGLRLLKYADYPVLVKQL
jgi:uncharacterized protein